MVDTDENFDFVGVLKVKSLWVLWSLAVTNERDKGFHLPPTDRGHQGNEKKNVFPSVVVWPVKISEQKEPTEQM